MRSATSLLAVLCALPLCLSLGAPRLRVRRAFAASPASPARAAVRASDGFSRCPGQDQFCAELCCPGVCCPSSLPFCVSAPGLGTVGVCADAEGKGRCDGTETPGTQCVAAARDGKDVCCAGAVFNRCTATPPYTCVTAEGFVECGDDGSPGVECPASQGACCPNPQRCCDAGCCDEGDGEDAGAAREVERLADTVPAQTPLPPSPEPLEPSPSEEPEDEDEDEPACFPAHAVVETEDGRVLRMDQLETGERVRTADGAFSEVVLWTHRDPAWRGRNYVRVALADGRTLVAAAGHLVYVWRQGREVRAVEHVRAGDGMLAVRKRGQHAARSAVVRVEAVDRVAATGLFNPQTVHGDIVVDGVLATCYTKAVDMRVAHALLAPVRCAARILAAPAWQLRSADAGVARN